MRTRVLRRPIVFLRVRCGILISLMRTVRCRIVCCIIPHCIYKILLTYHLKTRSCTKLRTEWKFSSCMRTNHRIRKLTASRFVAGGCKWDRESINSSGNSRLLETITSEWCNIRHETPDAYAAYQTWMWNGSLDCTGVVKYESHVSYTFLFISLE
jgi:hypothetical protein